MSKFFRVLVTSIALIGLAGLFDASAAIVQTAPASSPSAGSVADTMSTTLPDPDIATNGRTHTITTTRLDKEDDFEFWRRHANRVALFAKFLRGEK